VIVKLRVSSVLGTAAAALLASAALPVAAAFADTGPSVDAFASTPGPDAFTIGGYELDPYLGTPGFTTGEGFTVPPEITGTPTYFETGSVSPQVFEVFSPATSSNPAVELGAFSGAENVTTLGSITNTGFSVGQLIPTNANGILGLPQYGTVFDVTNFGNGVENEYINIPATNLTSGSITDTLVTPYGDYDLSNMFSGTHIVNLEPGAAFGISPDAAPPSTVDGFASTPGPDAFTLGGYEFDPYLGTPGAIDFEEFNLPSDITGTPPYFETGSVIPQVFEVFSPATSSTPATELGAVVTDENVSTYGNITNTGFTVTEQLPLGNDGSSLPATGTLYDVTNFGNGVENEYINIPATNLTSGSITDTLVTPYGDYDLSNLFSGSAIVALDPGAAFGISADTASAATEAATNVDPLSFLGL
jgi:hypothetical protein